MKLTDTKLRQVKPRGKRIDLSDGNGLMLRVSPNGQKRWSVRYRFAGKQARLKIGTYPDLSLAQAREKLFAIKGRVASGYDPATDMRTESLTVGELYEAWLDHFCNDNYAQHTLLALKGTFDHHILPRWQYRDIAGLRSADLFLLLNQAAKRRGHVGGPGAARNVKKHLNKMVKWAKTQGLVEVNHFADVQPPYKYVERTRTPSLDEARHIVSQVKEYGTYPYGPFVRLAMLTGLRRGELAQAEWSWLEDGALAVPVEATKTKAATHVVPLTSQMRGVIDELPRWGAYLFTHNGKRPVANNWVRPMKKVRSYCHVEHFTLHDFRRSMATEMDRMGVRSMIIELCLGHTQPQLRRAYRKYSFFNQKLEALQKWNDALTA